MRVILHICCQIQSTTSGLSYVNSGLGQDQSICNSANSIFNIHLNVSSLLFEICPQFCACYSPHMLPNTVQDIRFELRELWYMSSPAYFQVCICKHEYSSELISAAIGVIDNATSVIRHIFWKIQSTTSGLRYVNSGIGPEQPSYCFAHSTLNIQFKVSQMLFVICR